MISVEYNELQYPIIIEIPKGYWTFTNISEEKEEE